MVAKRAFQLTSSSKWVCSAWCVSEVIARALAGIKCGVRQGVTPLFSEWVGGGVCEGGVWWRFTWEKEGQAVGREEGVEGGGVGRSNVYARPAN